MFFFLSQCDIYFLFKKLFRGFSKKSVFSWGICWNGTKIYHHLSPANNHVLAIQGVPMPYTQNPLKHATSFPYPFADVQKRWGPEVPILTNVNPRLRINSSRYMLWRVI